MKLIVGLGNPGNDYLDTRHNVGFVIVDLLAKKLELEWSTDKKHQTLVAKEPTSAISAILAKPQTFMNDSGTAVQALLAYYKIKPDDLLVIHDDMDLEPGRIAFTARAGHAGHNGIRDIQEKLGTDVVSRLRIGIGRPIGQMPKEAWVLGRATAEEKKLLEDSYLKAFEAALTWKNDGLTAAMNTWNGRTTQS